MAVRLIDVAGAAGVSIASASRALSGATGVSDKVSEHVHAVALSLGYVTNMHARSLAGGTSSVVGIVCGDVRDPYFSEIVGGVIDSARASGRSVHVAHATSAQDVLEQVRLLRSYRVGSIVIASSGFVDTTAEAETDRELDAFRQSGGAVAVIGRHAISANAVLPDNEMAGALLARHLQELGHTRVALLAGPPDLTTVADRLAGVRTVFRDAPKFHADFSRDGGRDAAAAALDAVPLVTALVAFSDVMAVGVYSELRARGVRIPEDVSVVGFDDISMAVDLSPSLTTVQLNMSEIGTAALEFASASVVHGRKSLPVVLASRDSTGKSRSSRS